MDKGGGCDTPEETHPTVSFQASQDAPELATSETATTHSVGVDASGAMVNGSHDKLAAPLPAPFQAQLKRKHSDTDHVSLPSQLTSRTRHTSGSAGSSTGAFKTTLIKQRRAESKYIKAGDLVIIFISRDRPFSPLTVTPDQTFTNAFGTFPHNTIIGRPFGSQIRSSNNKGFLTLLRPTPELWTLSLPHRTQILYGPDMSFISMKMALGPGSRVVEAGTGSGSFTHFLARCVGIPEGQGEQGCQTMGREWKGQEGWGVSVGRGKGVQSRPPKDKSQSTEGTPGPVPPFKDTATSTPVEGPDGESQAEITSSQARRIQHFKSLASPTPDFDGEIDTNNGKIWTFEFHANRAALSRKEFLDHALTPLVSTSHRNVCNYGFPSSIDGLADAVFLDLPAPWEAIPFAPSVLNPKTQGVICCFSPCIEQVLRTVKALGVAGFQDVETFESLVRTHESIKSGFAGAGSAGGLFDMPLKEIGEIKGMLKERVRKREKMSENQRKKAREKKERLSKANGDKLDTGSEKEEAGSDNEEDGEGDDADNKMDITGDVQENEGSGSAAQQPMSAAAVGSEAQATSPVAAAEAATTSTASPPNSHGDSKDTSTGAASSSAYTRKQISFSPPLPSTHPLPSHFGQGKEYKQQLVRSNTYSRFHASMRGHTSYLTFGRLPPRGG